MWMSERRDMPAKGEPQRKPLKPIYKPSDCPHCAHDRQFPDCKGGGWIYQGNNGPVVSCPVCNDDGSHDERE